MNEVYAKLQHCVTCVRAKTDFVPRVALVLGCFQYKGGNGDFL